MPSKRNWWKSKKPLNTCYYGTCYMYLKNHQFCPERMNIHTGMSHAKCQMNKDSKKDRSVSLLFSFSQEFTIKAKSKEVNRKLVYNILRFKEQLSTNVFIF